MDQTLKDFRKAIRLSLETGDLSHIAKTEEAKARLAGSPGWTAAGAALNLKCADKV